MGNQIIELTVKAQALALTEIAGFSNRKTSFLLQNAISHVQIAEIRQTAREKGWNPALNPCLKPEHLADKPRSGRPRKLNEQEEKDLIISVTATATTREQSAEILEETVDISASTIKRIFYKYNYRRRKPEQKPDLDQDDRMRHYHFCEQFRNWTEED